MRTGFRSPSMRRVSLLVALLVVVLATACGKAPGQPTRLDFRTAASPGLTHGPPRALPENPRYFTDGSGQAIFLTGSHTWDNRQDIGRRRFDWMDSLRRLERYNHNFVRLWVWEQPKGLTTWPDSTEPMATIAPELFNRTGPGVAADGGLKFDLTRYK